MVKDKMREFTGGAKRDTDENKLQFTRCLSPIVLIRVCEFLRKFNKTPDGKRREDNWKKGFDLDSYLESKGRHFVESWLIYEGYKDDESLDLLIDSLCAEMFNTQGFIHMLLMEQRKRQKNKKKLPAPLVNRLAEFSEISKEIADMSPADFKKGIKALGCLIKKKKIKKRAKKKAKPNKVK